ncbi:MAG: ribulose-phosphate 3-epimerase [Candidatus Izemoplasmatales bacterium]|nr:ribulose-phosphate 3-epimerase [Candidatus Izemoplasmatales bacterium]
MIVAPSFLTADFSKLEAEITSIKRAKWLHFDVMDGLFVSNTTYDENTLREVRTFSDQFFDCHLMIVDPKRQIPAYINCGAELVTFHYEAALGDISTIIKMITDRNTKVGISIKPDTKPEVLLPFLDRLDLILVMSVEPGKGGQKFMPSAISKLRYFDKLRKENGYHYLLEVDGGINDQTAPLVKDAGADVIVVGSFLFNKADRDKAIWELEHV